MTNLEKLALMKNRLMELQYRGDKNVKSGGVIRKLKRQIRNLENQN